MPTQSLPLRTVRLGIERRGFDGVAVLAQTTSGEDGAFALAPFETRPGDELVAEGPLHAPLRCPLPPSGELHVRLVLRKRALLDRLVTWARARGAPYDPGFEPTPGHVRAAAGSELGVARWADAVEQAAYGGAAVDGGAQAEVDRLAPARGVPGESNREPIPPPADAPVRPR